MDFKSLRSDKLKLTQEEFANLYGISIQEVQELDKTGKPDMDLIVKIATKSGLDFNTILSYEKPRVKPISAKDTWEKTNFTKKSLSGYLNSALEQMDIPDDMRKNYIDDLEIGIMSKFVKPTVAIVGRSDTGKSTLINSLIGAEKMPAKWTPTTSTAVYVKHIKDRPAFIHDEAWIFKRECGNEKFWNSKRLYDEKYCEKWKVAGGDLSLLETYSTRQGGGLKTEAGSAVVFVDAPILLNCDIIDLPGYGTETASDDVITAKTAAHADVLIYLSLASGFLRIEDIEYLKNNVRTLPVLEKKGENGLKPLANLFVIGVFSTVQFVKLVCKGESLKTAAIQVGKQALFSLSLLVVSITAQGIFGGPSGIIVSVGVGVIFVTYTIADTVHQRNYSEKLRVYMIEKCKPIFA